MTFECPRRCGFCIQTTRPAHDPMTCMTFSQLNHRHEVVEDGPDALLGLQKEAEKSAKAIAERDAQTARGGAKGDSKPEQGQEADDEGEPTASWRQRKRDQNRSNQGTAATKPPPIVQRRYGQLLPQMIALAQVRPTPRRLNLRD